MEHFNIIDICFKIWQNKLPLTLVFMCVLKIIREILKTNHMFNDNKRFSQSLWTHASFGVHQVINADYFTISTWIKGFQIHFLLTSSALLTDVHFWCLLLPKIKEHNMCLLRQQSQRGETAGQSWRRFISSRYILHSYSCIYLVVQKEENRRVFLEHSLRPKHPAFKEI